MTWEVLFMSFLGWVHGGFNIVVTLFALVGLVTILSKSSVSVYHDQTTGVAVVEWNKRLYRLVPLEGEIDHHATFNRAPSCKG